MAEEKKPEGKPAGVSTAEKDPFIELVTILFIVIVLASLTAGLSSLFGNVNGGANGVPWYEKFTPTGIMKANTRSLSSLSNPIGARVVSLKNTDVYDSPGGKKIGSHKAGDKGKVLQGPVEINGEKYYYVDYDTDPDGWVKEGDVGATSVPVSSVFDPVGSRVENTNDANVYDENGNKIGSHKAGDKGKITKGPIYINGEKYWYVDYDSGADGWVKESDLGVLVDEPNIFERFILWFFGLFGWIRLILYLLSLIFIAFIIYLFIRINKIAAEQRKLFYPETKVEESPINPKWQRVLDYVESTNENDWRLAIIEADIILGELLDTMNIYGETIGDKLKIVEASDFRTLDSAWEAHKFRNSIAHEGASFLINQREAKRVIGLFQTVFEEFEII